jgi:triosephosphate isomerase
MPTSIIAGNWKMNTTIQEAKALVTAMRPRLDAIGGVQKVVCPPFVSLAEVRDVLRGSSIGLGAQNMHHEEKGAFTGEVSPAMLVGLCQYVILGHSERRQLFGEADDFINKKVKAALKAGLRPILCVGERLPEREEGRAEEVVEGQLRGSLAGIDAPGGLVVAYEPVWAIGTGRAATPDIAQSMMAHIRRVLSSLWGQEAANDTSLLYGGSVNPGNTSDFMRQKDINGALVGGASLQADSFIEIVKKAADARS